MRQAQQDLSRFAISRADHRRGIRGRNCNPSSASARSVTPGLARRSSTAIEVGYYFHQSDSAGREAALRRLLWQGDNRFCYTEVAEPPLPGPHEVLLQVRAVGICSTDLHILNGNYPTARPPLVLGHEIAGEVLKVGAEVDVVRPGDRVTIDQVLGCGECFFCRRGSAQFCPAGCELGITGDGGCQDLLLLPARNAHPVPDSISFEEAAILDMEVWAALAKAGVRPGETAAVVGHGPAGLVACQILRACGAGKVFLSGRSLSRLRKAIELGVADHVVTCADFPETIRIETEGRGVDIAFECAGTKEAVESAIEAVTPGGRVVLYGLQTAPLDGFDLNRILLRDLVVYGSLSDRKGWTEVIGLVAQGKLKLKPLITHRFELQQAREAYDLMRRREDGVIKAVFVL
jgi:2-desacetyl-2-hydroxyethyl bacteriochlorophyllide A dehydrogenase